MKEGNLPVLLVHDQSISMQALNHALHQQFVPTQQVRTCEEAARLLGSAEPPELVFADTELPDGNWADVVLIAEKAPLPVNVIVVSRLVDVPFYVEVLENGAFDFIAPPFEPIELAHILRCAKGNIDSRRRLLARATQTQPLGPHQLRLPRVS